MTVNENEEMQLIPNVSCILKEFEQMSPRVVKSIEVRRLVSSNVAMISWFDYKQKLFQLLFILSIVQQTNENSSKDQIMF